MGTAALVATTRVGTAALITATRMGTAALVATTRVGTAALGCAGERSSPLQSLLWRGRPRPRSAFRAVTSSPETCDTLKP